MSTLHTRVRIPCNNIRSLSAAADGLKGGVPPPGSGGAGAGDSGPSFTYSGADDDMARRLFESLFGGAGGFTFSSAQPGPGGHSSFQFMSTGPGGAAFVSTPRPGSSSRMSHNPFNIHTTSGGQANNRRRWASAFGGNTDSDEDMFTAGAPGADPFAAFSMGGGPGSSFHHQQQQRRQPGQGHFWGDSSSQPFGFGGYQQQQQQQPPSPQMVALPLTLEELYSGCTKRLKVCSTCCDVVLGWCGWFGVKLTRALHSRYQMQHMSALCVAAHVLNSLTLLSHSHTCPLLCRPFVFCPRLRACVAAQVTRHVMDAASRKTLPVLEVLEVQVKPGWKEGTRVTFAGKGDETSPGTAADLVFVVKQQPHARFERRGNDLLVRVKLPLVTALTGGAASVVMPDGRPLSLPISSPPVQPGATRLVVGEGMPISKGGKGDLHVTFDVVFPTHLTAQQKAQLRQVLPSA